MKNLKLALVADGDTEHQVRLIDLLEEQGWHVVSCFSAAEAVEEAGWYRPKTAFIDSRLTADGGLDLIPAIKGASPETRVILMDLDADWDHYLEVLREGASDLLRKPVTREDVTRTVA